MTTRLKYSYDVDLAESNSAASKVIRFVGKAKRVLEVGAGPGSIARLLKERFHCDVTAIEIDAASVGELDTFCDRVFQLDLNDPLWPAALAGIAPFQFVIAADVLEHLLDPLATLTALKELLADDGHLVVSLPNVAHNGVIATLLDDDFRYGEWGLLDRTHIRFFGIRNIDALFDAAELDIVAREFVTRHPSETEFADAWNRLPADLSEPLSFKPSGNVYQVVLLARPAGRNEARRHTANGRLELAQAQRTADGPAGAGAVTSPTSDPEPGAPLGALMLKANEAHQAGELAYARRLFQRAISEYGANFDALHLLGVIAVQEGRAECALPFFREALPLLNADFPPFFRNLGLCLAAIWRARNPLGVAAAERSLAGSARIYRGCDLPSLPTPPCVSVILTTAGANGSVDAAIESVGRQTYPDIELIVISAGTSEAEFSRLARALKAGRISGRCIRAAPGGECGAINQGIADASGRLIALLEADDVFAATRVEHLARLVCGTGARWGFSNVAFIDSASRPVSFGERPDVDEAMRFHESLLARFAVSEAVMQSSLLTTAGNLFFERALWQEIGGFKPLRFHRNWLFGLTASLRAEPAYLDEPDYVERIGAVPATREEVRARAEEELVVRASWLAHVERLRDLPNHVLERANKVVRQRDFAIMANGGGHLLDRRLLLKYASELGSEVIPEGGQVR